MAVNPFPTPYPSPTPQLAYNNNFSQPLPGVPADGSFGNRFVTGINPNGISIFGCAVVNDPSVTTTLQGGIAQGIKHPASAGDVTGGVVGIVVRSAAMESRRDGLPPSYSAKDPVNVQRVGVVWTASEVAVTVHDPVYIRVTANGSLNQIGTLRNDSDSGNAVLFPGAKWFDTQATPGGAARVELNLIGQ